MKPTTLARAAFALFASVFASCDGGAGAAAKGTGRLRFALIVKTQQNPVFVCMQHGAEKAARELGVDVKTFSPADEKNFQEQADLVRVAVRQRFDAVLIAPADSKLLVAPLKEAKDAGAAVVNIDNSLDPDEARAQGLQVDAFVGVDNVAGGLLAAEFLAERLGRKGEVAMLEGFVGVANSEDRKRGFREGIARFPEMQLVAIQTGEWYPTKALEATQGILQRYTNLAGLFCANDLMALGAIRAAEQAGRLERLTIVAFDNLSEVRGALLSGALAGTIEQFPDWMGETAVRVAHELLTTGTIASRDLRSPLEMVSAESLKTKDVKPLSER